METTTTTTMPKKALVVVLMVIAILMLATMTACAGKPAEEMIREDITAELDSIKNIDQKALDELLKGSSSVSSLNMYGISTEELFRSWLGGFDYSIDKVTVNGDKATATVTVKIKSLTSAMKSITDNISSILASKPELRSMTQSEIYKEVGKILMDALDEAPIESVTIDLPYELKNNAWQRASGFEAALSKAFTATSS